MPSRISTPMAKRQQLTLAQLAAYDDILTDALVDHVSLAEWEEIGRGCAHMPLCDTSRL